MGSDAHIPQTRTRITRTSSGGDVGCSATPSASGTSATSTAASAMGSAKHGCGVTTWAIAGGGGGGGGGGRRRKELL